MAQSRSVMHSGSISIRIGPRTWGRVGMDGFVRPGIGHDSAVPRSDAWRIYVPHAEYLTTESGSLHGSWRCH